jgi:hypothetical protein
MRKKFVCSILFLFLVLAILFLVRKTYQNNSLDKSDNSYEKDIKLSSNDKIINVLVKITDYSNATLDKWYWHSSEDAEPNWFRAYWGMSDPRKFSDYEGYKLVTTDSWRVNTNTNSANNFYSWRDDAFKNKNHDLINVRIIRDVEIKGEKFTYVYAAIEMIGMSPITLKNEKSITIACLVKYDEGFKCADVPDDVEFFLDPRDTIMIHELLRRKRGVIVNKMLCLEPSHSQGSVSAQ